MSISFLDNGLRIRFSGKSDIGRVRNHNEDDILLPSEIPIAAVSDGMGGHACGEVASHLAVETVDNYYARTCAEAPPNSCGSVNHCQRIRICWSFATACRMGAAPRSPMNRHRFPSCRKQDGAILIRQPWA